MQALLSIFSGSLVGFSLGLLGGGGSILAVPLLVYVVGVSDPHLAIGTSALAVAINAFANLLPHHRAGNVKWACAAVFAGAGVIGAAGGAALGKAIDGKQLLFLFGLLMIAVALAMLSPRAAGSGSADVRLDGRTAPRLAVAGLAVGSLSGFFGIGGGFLIVPALMLGAGMLPLNAVASSLFSVGVFGLTTAISYAWSGLVDWPVAALFILGGIAGGAAGALLAGRLAAERGALTRLFAVCVLVVAAFILWKSGHALFA